jgi:hypothetical protein
MQLTSATAICAQTIRVGENVRVTLAPHQMLVEPHLALNPADPSHLLGVAIVSPVTGSFADRLSQQTCASFLSTDGGETWARYDFPITRCFDPWVAFTPHGDAVFTAVGKHPALAEQGNQGLIVVHSPDGGRTWDEQPVGLGRGPDHPTIVVDWTASKRRGWVYVLSGQTVRTDDGTFRWNVFVARSRDGGRAFDEPTTFAPNNLANHAEIPVILSDGALLVSFVDGMRNVNNFRGPGGMLDRRRAWVARSLDGGSTFSMPLFVNEACGPPPGFRLSALVVDTSSGPFHDRLYFACRQKGAGPIVVNSSTDRGETWTDPVPIHSTPPDSTVERDIGALAVNKWGVLGIAWTDGRSQPGGGCQQAYFTASLDGGRSFLPERPLFSARSCVDSTANGGAVYRERPVGGDYFGMVTRPDGLFRLLWADARDGVFQLWTATIAVQGNTGEGK